ncbi:hypothetical protein B0O99DRAFT_690501 [Bisporella sp. PMI_857]|nr:hypothetical protein B0O99DRAFT_690501 [Bisporella sp. PMI_857]
MAVLQVISMRYIDREKLGNLLAKEFGSQPYTVESKDGSYILTIPRHLTEDEIKSIEYDSNN